jgi:hypothetical protein
MSTISLSLGINPVHYIRRGFPHALAESLSATPDSDGYDSLSRHLMARRFEEQHLQHLQMLTCNGRQSRVFLLPQVEAVVYELTHQRTLHHTQLTHTLVRKPDLRPIPRDMESPPSMSLG